MTDAKAKDTPLNLEWLTIYHRPELSNSAIDAAIDVANTMLANALDVAQHLVGHAPERRDEALKIAAMHVQAATEVHKAQALVTAIQGLSVAVKSASDDSATVLETAAGNMDSSIEGLSSQFTFSGGLLNERLRGIEVTLEVFLSELRSRPA